MAKTIRFGTAAPSHSYTYYHECDGEVTLHDDGRVTVASDMTNYSGLDYRIKQLGLNVSFAIRPTIANDGSTVFYEDPTELTFDSIEDALMFFTNEDHNGAGANLRSILKDARANNKKQ